MSDVVTDLPRSGVGAPVLARLSVLDRFLPVWILAAMGAGLGLGRAAPSVKTVLDSAQVTSGVSLPIFVGLLVMMYPVLAKVRYGQLDRVTRDTRMLLASLVLNWVVGPALMFALAWLLLPDQPAYRLPMSPDIDLLILDIRTALWNAGTGRVAGVVDVALAATAVHAAATVLHYDSDFDHITAAYPRLHAAWVVPRGSID